ncbi:hypothetical protein J8F10_03810 [Gemmata sp. G18]|uniref:Uncharacterized protein n=1 Tax=Gemmata palustris TaxID=2822762 RepID=A0ABS5BL29_9BACT|nr:hypothetical protein [Gemmata palustris]MBP3954415.1 hypothetical protein [Gemmata palustris]
MGGTFSGYRGSKKRVVESCDALDTADLKRWGMLVRGTDRAGVLDWRRGGEEKPSSSVAYVLAAGAENGVLRLQYQIGPPAESLDYAIRLVTTGCHLGGVRWWFICPLVRDGVACGRRVRKLYRRGKYFGCRHCHSLAYRSTQESDSRVYAALRRGAHLHEFGDVRGMSVSQLGLALKVLTAGQKRLERFIRR